MGSTTFKHILKKTTTTVCLSQQGEYAITKGNLKKKITDAATDIGVDLFSWWEGGGGDDRCPRPGSEETERGEGVGYPPPTVGTFSKIGVSKSHFRAFQKLFFRELNVVKIHGEELSNIIEQLFTLIRIRWLR